MLDPTGIEWGLFGLWYVVFLFSLTVHEGAHALAAHLGGDDTAYHGGQVSLNPLPHMRQEPVGTLLFPLLSFLSFGWVMGWASTPFDPDWADHHPRRAAFMSLAGPGGNLLLAVGAFALARFLLRARILDPPEMASFSQVLAPATGAPALWSPLSNVLSMMLVLNVMLFLFNLIPLPPLDGSGALQGLLPSAAADRYREFASMPGVGLLGMLALWYGFGRIFSPAFGLLLRLLHPGVGYSG